MWGVTKGEAMGQRLVRIWLVVELLLLSGCIGPLQQWGEETTFRPKSASFDAAKLKLEQAAVLNAVVGFGLEGYAHQVSRSLSSALDERPTVITALPIHEALNRPDRGPFRAHGGQLCRGSHQVGVGQTGFPPELPPDQEKRHLVCLRRHRGRCQSGHELSQSIRQDHRGVVVPRTIAPTERAEGKRRESEDVSP